MATWKDALTKTRKTVFNRIASILKISSGIDEAELEELEELLLQADVPVRMADELLEAIGKDGRQKGVSRIDFLKQWLLKTLMPAQPFAWRQPQRPYTVLIVGVNGSGKTTTCAKLAGKAMADGLIPVLGATDTFRAAGSEQLKLWADRLGCDAVIGRQGADAAAVAYDAMDAAIARKADLLIVDTAGRMHTKQPLMDELQKVRRSLNKRLEGAPHETWVVLDATSGRNAVEQARVFNEAAPLSGAVIAKLDGSAKAGFVFSLSRELGFPIRFVGLGEGPDDLAPFVPENFVDALFDSGDESNGGRG